jgi:hypothetical protein
MNAEAKTEEMETIRVAAPVGDPDLPICSEVMHALPDPAHGDQAVLVNTPFLVDELNYGDIVRLGPEDEHGVRPIVEVVLASGHVHFLVATETGEGIELIAELERSLPAYAFRITRARDDVLSVSLHPDLDAGSVVASIEGWLGLEPEGLDVFEDGPAVGPICATALGPLGWPAVSG